ncbi:MAG: hypothetical protein CMC93_07850 [Flavobacteriaceae bacterium]|nr:hypothetical protein [Flavobacteriaceae bacterium]|tara:strand:- start:2074 stop:2298 length:225 start_codon:yes stop_codon:yes gene_type:complete
MSHERVVNKITKSKVDYAITLMKSITHHEKLGNQQTILDNLWELSGFRSNYIFQKKFREIEGVSVKYFFDQISK